MRSTQKLGLTVVVVLAMSVPFAAPAAALAPVDVESGTLTTVLGSFDLTPGSQGTPPCPEKGGALDLTTRLTENPPNPPIQRWVLGGFFSSQLQFPPLSGNWYQADFTILPGSGGAWAGAHPANTLTGAIGLQIRIYQLQLAGQPPTCTKNNLRCIITGAFTLAATSTYTSGPFNTTGLPATEGHIIWSPWLDYSDHVTIDATSGPLAVASCQGSWGSVGGTTATLTNFHLHVL